MSTIHEQLVDDLRARSAWEAKMRLWYEMVLQGLRRKKTAQWQADLRDKLIDNAIGKLLPFYYQQVFSSPRIVNFKALSPEMEAFAEDCADYLDWDFKNDHDINETSRFQQTILITSWMMCAYGRGIVKQWWNPATQRVDIEPIHPLQLVVPWGTKRLHEADRFAHVISLTIEQYLRDSRYLAKDEVSLARISGGTSVYEGDREYREQKCNREGFTHSINKDEIILWEEYQKTAGGWLVTTISPQSPGVRIRAPFLITSKWKGTPFLPFTSFVLEYLEGGWYEPRGIAERLSNDQNYAQFLRNARADHMRFSATPLFTSEAPIGNLANQLFNPGDILGGNVKAVEFPQLPISFTLELQEVRQTAAEYIALPDASIQRPLPGTPRGTTGKSGFPTAAQVNYESALAQVQVDLSGEKFRWGMLELARKRWALVVGKNSKAVRYLTAKGQKQLPPEALSEMWEIEVAGSSEAWNKQQKLERSMMRYQTLQGNPFVNMPEVTKALLAADDPRTVDRFFNDPQQKQVEDIASRIRALFELRFQLQQSGVPADPVMLAALNQQTQQYLQALGQLNPQLAQQFMQAMVEVTAPQSQPEQVPQLA